MRGHRLLAQSKTVHDEQSPAPPSLVSRLEIFVIAPISDTSNTWDLMEDRRGIVRIEQLPIPGVQSCIPSPYISLTYLTVVHSV